MKTALARYAGSPTQAQSTAVSAYGVLSAIFVMGHGVRECMWACKNIGTGYRAPQVLLEALIVMIGLCSPHH